MKSHKNNLNNLIESAIGLETEKLTLNVLFKSFPAAFYCIDRNGHCLDCNDNEVKILNLASKADVIGRHAAEVADRKAWENSEEVMRKDRPLITEETHFAPTGETLTFLSIKNPLYDKADNVVGMSGIAIDITDRKKLENNLQVAKEEAETALALRMQEQTKARNWEKPLALKEALIALPEKRYYLTGKYQEIYLTTREAQCIPCLIRGLSAKEIGNILGVSQRTIEVHLNSLKIKLQCKNRTQLVTTAIENRFLDSIQPLPQKG